MKRIIALCSTVVLSLVFVAVMANPPIQKVHKENPKAKRADKQEWACGTCHAGKPEDGAIAKGTKGKLKKGEANHGTLKDNARCKECHK